MYRPMRQNKPRRVIHDVAELPVLCDCAEAGLLLRRNPEVIAKMAKEGVLKGAKQGQSWFFRRDDLVEYIVERMADPNKEQRRSDPRPTSDSLFREAFGLNRRKE